MSHKYINHSELGFIAWRRTDLVAHSDVAATMLQHRGNILSAGFVHFATGKPVCYGESFSLRIKSREGDSTEYTKQLGIA